MKEITYMLKQYYYKGTAKRKICKNQLNYLTV